MKEIGNGRQDVWRLLLETWKSLQEHNDQVNYMERPRLFVPMIWWQTFGDKHLVTIGCFSWKITFWEIEIYFWMYMWRYISIVESLIYIYIVFVGWQINKESNIEGIFQSAMSRLRKRHPLNVNVRKRGSVFAKCTICESLKDLISKLGKNSNESLEYETKLIKHIFHHKSCRNLYHIWRTELV